MRQSTTANGHYPPHSLAAEESVLGAILLSQRTIEVAAVDEGLRPAHFYREQHADIFRAMLDLHEASEPVDVLTLVERLRAAGRLERVGGEAAVYALAGSVPAAANVRQYARLVRERALARDLQAAAQQILSEIADERPVTEALEHAERQVIALSSQTRSGQAVQIADALYTELDRLQQLAAAGQNTVGLSTGIRELDERLGGLHPGNLIVLAARPGMGKSTLAQQIATHAAFREEAVVAMFSLEMSAGELAQRHLASHTPYSADRLRKAKVPSGDWPTLLQTASHAASRRLLLYDISDLSAFELRGLARQARSQHRALDLVVVDYLQLLRAEPPSGNRTEDVSGFSRALKRLARELECPVLAVAQLNRGVEARVDKRPLLSDLRDSGQIEADSDVVLFVYRDDYYDPDSERPDEAELLIRKNRNGPSPAEVTMRFDAEHARYLELDRIHA